MRLGFGIQGVAGWAMSQGLMAQAVEDEDIRGMKPLIEISPPPAPVPWALYFGAGLGTLVVLGLLWWWWRKRQRTGLSAERVASGELVRLGAQASGFTAGDFALAASQVVRQFVASKFGLAAPQRTTEEFLVGLAALEDPAMRTRLEPLRGFLRACDQAKFAGGALTVDERAGLIEKALEFVNAPDEAAPEQSGDAKGSETGGQA